jgi:radical SAM protein with 4Fe4S-binding SPASM domain
MVRKAFESAKCAYKGNMQVLVDYWISDSEAERLEASRSDSPRRGNFLSRGANGIEHITGRCFAASLMAVVTADGTVYPCCNLRGLKDWALGKVDYKADITFRSIWHGQQRRRVMERIRKIECIKHCTHPLSKYNEIIHYLKSPRYHAGFV